jgi:hypothetical protein
MITEEERVMLYLKMRIIGWSQEDALVALSKKLLILMRTRS